MERCPLCRARLEPDPVCPRCGADHRSAQAAEAQAKRCLLDALAARTVGDLGTAQAYARQALALHRTPLNEIVARWLNE